MPEAPFIRLCKARPADHCGPNHESKYAELVKDQSPNREGDMEYISTVYGQRAGFERVPLFPHTSALLPQKECLQRCPVSRQNGFAVEQNSGRIEPFIFSAMLHGENGGKRLRGSKNMECQLVRFVHLQWYRSRNPCPGSVDIHNVRTYLLGMGKGALDSGLYGCCLAANVASPVRLDRGRVEDDGSINRMGGYRAPEEVPLTVHREQNVTGTSRVGIQIGMISFQYLEYTFTGRPDLDKFRLVFPIRNHDDEILPVSQVRIHFSARRVGDHSIVQQTGTCCHVYRRTWGRFCFLPCLSLRT